MEEERLPMYSFVKALLCSIATACISVYRCLLAPLAARVLPSNLFHINQLTTVISSDSELLVKQQGQRDHKDVTLDAERREEELDGGEIINALPSDDATATEGSNPAPAWEKVKDLGGRMLFLGMNCSEAFAADMFRSKAGFKGDCIYYTGDGGCMDLRAPCAAHDMGVYSMEDGVIGAFFSPDGDEEEDPVYPPVWVSANPWPFSLQLRSSHL